MSEYINEWLKHKTDPAKLARETIRHIDKYDRRDLSKIAKEIKDYRIAQNDIEAVLDTGRVLFDDTTMAFLKAIPTLNNKGNMRPTHLVNHSVMSEFMNLEEFERLRQWTQGDIVAAAQAAVRIEPEIEKLADRLKKSQEANNALQDRMMEYLAAEEALRDLEEMIEQWRDMPDFDEMEMQELLDQINNSMQDAMDAMMSEAEDAEQEIQEAIRTSMAGLRVAMDREANGQQDMAATARGWGVEPGELRKMDPARRLALAERLNTNKFKRLADIWGPMQRVAFNEQSRKVYHSFEEVYDVGIGGDLSHILPSELVGLDDESMELDFFRRFVERQLLEYKLQGIEKIGKGAIIMCIDNSGSMSGDPEIWSKAVGLCALNIAKQQRRSFIGIHFGSASEIAIYDFRNPDDITIEQVLDYAEYFRGGGTNFETPFSVALKFLQDEFDEKGFVEGDIIFVTDGECGVNANWQQKFLEEKERIGFKVHSFVIGGSIHREPLPSLSDDIKTIKDLLAEEAKDLFGRL